jgi:hypothetical protein
VHFWITEPPAPVIFQFLPSFVLLIIRKPESAWIRGVNGNWQAQFSAFFPNRIEFGIVDPDQFAGLVTKIKPQPFIFLKARSS